MGRCQRCLAESGHRPRWGWPATNGRCAPRHSPDQPRTKYVAPVRGYLTWLAASDRDVETDGDPLDEPAGRDDAVRDWCAWPRPSRGLRPATINNTLAAIDDFYTAVVSEQRRPAAKRCPAERPRPPLSA
jgi:hypothetical protein